MKRFSSSLTVLAVFCLSLSNLTALDPCGMVPPIYTGNVVPIKRIGLQQTYVFYKDGVESVVIRPGFSGNVDNFGMLIPFPSAPELRKVSDGIFEHLDNAIDPPEVVVDLRAWGMKKKGQMAQGNGIQLSAISDTKTKSNVVRVLKKEAVGMYEVAVLEAGSAAALQKWLEQHEYQYPKGMDDVANEYVEEGWCFVAVKTKVGQKDGADPVPGQRNVQTEMPSNSVFDGHVQGMGFRFQSAKLVVPMRLSAFNEGSLRNIVYLLADSPKRIRNIPEEYVVRQISGKDLHRNVTQPLPLRILGGTEKDIPQPRRQSLKSERDPKEKNGIAKTLFASDLLAVSSGDLSLKMEEDEKQLLQINEHFGLRGPEIDKTILSAQQVEADKIADQAIAQINSMTLTLVDGDFPRQVLANQNLGFADYRMPAYLNRADIYDAKAHGQLTDLFENQGIRIGQVDLTEWEILTEWEMNQIQARNVRWFLIVGSLSIGLIWSLQRIKENRRNKQVQGQI